MPEPVGLAVALGEAQVTPTGLAAWITRGKVAGQVLTPLGARHPPVTDLQPVGQPPWEETRVHTKPAAKEADCTRLGNPLAQTLTPIGARQPPDARRFQPTGQF